MRSRPIVGVNASTGCFAIRLGMGRYCLAQTVVNGDWSPQLGEDVSGDFWQDGPTKVCAAGALRDVNVIAAHCGIDVIRNELLS